MKNPSGPIDIFNFDEIVGKKPFSFHLKWVLYQKQKLWLLFKNCLLILNEQLVEEALAQVSHIENNYTISKVFENKKRKEIQHVKLKLNKSQQYDGKLSHVPECCFEK